jgi:putative ABC transport system permease protein
MVLADVRRSWTGAIAVLLLVALAVGLGVAVSMQERALRQGSARAADPFDLLIGAPGSEAQLVLTSVYLQPAAPDLIDGRILAELEDDERVGLGAGGGLGENQ